MYLKDIKDKLDLRAYERISKEIVTLRPSQEKSVEAGIFEKNNILVCTPTASGKTLVSEFAITDAILKQRKKAIYIVPLKALAAEKHKHFKTRYEGLFKTALSISDIDSTDSYLANYDLIICTSEKLDSLIRHSTPWLSQVECLIVDEIHLLNDPNRGPTLEILITLLREILKRIQIIGLSATIGNAPALASWLDAKLVIDTWRPVELRQGIHHDDRIKYE